MLQAMLEKVIIQSVILDDPRLPSVIEGAIGHPSPEKVQEVIKSYQHPDHAIIGALIGDSMVGVLGFCHTHQRLTIRHITVLLTHQRQGIGTLLVDEVKKQYADYTMVAETDTESVNFYPQSGFTCHGFNGPYGNLRYTCQLNQ